MRRTPLARIQLHGLGDAIGLLRSEQLRPHHLFHPQQVCIQTFSHDAYHDVAIGQHTHGLRRLAGLVHDDQCSYVVFAH